MADRLCRRKLGAMTLQAAFGRRTGVRSPDGLVSLGPTTEGPLEPWADGRDALGITDM